MSFTGKAQRTLIPTKTSRVYVQSSGGSEDSLSKSSPVFSTRFMVLFSRLILVAIVLSCFPLVFRSSPVYCFIPSVIPFPGLLFRELRRETRIRCGIRVCRGRDVPFRFADGCILRIGAIFQVGSIVQGS